MSQGYSKFQDAVNQLKLAEQTIIQAQKDTANNSPQQQQWMQKTLGAVSHAKEIIESSIM
jgi:hypothetical protein